ncbi:NOP protein chaperone 1 [Denticeps clupeoides]|uniref:NOP protein chaperone 1 n=1 Tax=Denticeps clupeoides TaxID=299321 RepID=UPI0010A3E7BF|nr:uncharacterized protein C12orf45 homolog [Denticeps clupeoides]XP_028809801.1 uncharacterized protein C12orf45 homolog [Denticeps clupeoides]
MEHERKVHVSQELLSCGNERSVQEKLLLKPRSPPKTCRVPTSGVLERLHSFLPKIAQANETLKQCMSSAPEGHFNIENVEESKNVIEMDVALVELRSSSDEAESSEDDNSDTDSEEDEKLKLPGDGSRKRKADIQVLEGEDV